MLGSSKPLIFCSFFIVCKKYQFILKKSNYFLYKSCFFLSTHGLAQYMSFPTICPFISQTHVRDGLKIAQYKPVYVMLKKC